MRLLTTLILTFLIISSTSLKAQEKQLFFNVSAISQPEVFYFSSGSSGYDEVKTPPATQVNFGIQSQIRNSSWIAEIQLSYLSIIASEKAQFRDENNNPIPTASFERIHNTNEAGVKAGIGYSIQSRNEKHHGQFIIGASGYLPFLSYRHSEATGLYDEKVDTYTGQNFSEGILYGAYFKPTYQVKIGKTSSPWSLSIFAEANLIWRNLTNYLNPIFMAGGGLGVNYTLR